MTERVEAEQLCNCGATYIPNGNQYRESFTCSRCGHTVSREALPHWDYPGYRCTELWPRREGDTE